jgi:hypothetical protein
MNLSILQSILIRVNNGFSVFIEHLLTGRAEMSSAASIAGIATATVNEVRQQSRFAVFTSREL